MGDIVLFRVGPNCLVPLLVGQIVDNEVTGTVFLSTADECSEPWIKSNLFWLPNPERPFFSVKDIARGTNVGQWRAKE